MPSSPEPKSQRMKLMTRSKLITTTSIYEEEKTESVKNLKDKIEDLKMALKGNLGDENFQSQVDTKRDDAKKKIEELLKQIRDRNLK